MPTDVRCSRCRAQALDPNLRLEICIEQLIASSRQRAQYHHLTYLAMQEDLCSTSDAGNVQIDILGNKLSENAIAADIASMAPVLSGAYNPLCSAALGPNHKFPHLHARSWLGRKMPKSYRETRNHCIRAADFENSLHLLQQPLVTFKLSCASRLRLLDTQNPGSEDID